MRKRTLYFLCLAAMLSAAGCGKKEEPALGGLSEVKEVVNFSDFTETEIQTEPQTEPPTEPPTEPQTETEVQTEPPTEPQTEPAEQPYEEDFDFSDEKVLGAFYSIHTLDELSRQDGFSDTVTEDETQRTRTVSLSGGEVEIRLYADRYSGATNGRLEVSASNTYLGAVKEALAALEAGLDEDNMDAFILGSYNGAERAPYIGLADASCSTEGGRINVVLQKAAAQEGAVPGLSNEAGPSEFALEESIFRETLSQEGADPFFSLIEGTEGSLFETKERSVASAAKHFDRDGNLISQDGIFSGRYEAGTTSYTFTSSMEEGKLFLSITYAQEKEMADAEIAAKAEHLYQYFYHGAFDKEKPLAEMVPAHGSLAREGNGFILKVG